MKNVDNTISYNLISTSSAFVHRDYIRAIDRKELYRCQGLGLSALVSAKSRLPPIQMKANALEFGWDRLLVTQRNSMEQKKLSDGRQCVEGIMSKLGLEDLPQEDYVYIGVE